MSMLELEELKIIKLVRKKKQKPLIISCTNQSWFKLQLNLCLYPSFILVMKSVTVRTIINTPYIFLAL